MLFPTFRYCVLLRFLLKRRFTCLRKSNVNLIFTYGARVFLKIKVSLSSHTFAFWFSPLHSRIGSILSWFCTGSGGCAAPLILFFFLLFPFKTGPFMRDGELYIANKRFEGVTNTVTVRQVHASRQKHIEATLSGDESVFLWTLNNISYHHREFDNAISLTDKCRASWNCDKSEVVSLFTFSRKSHSLSFIISFSLSYSLPSRTPFPRFHRSLGLWSGVG